jgi:peptide/nickel transport system substrate-binding protein
MLKEALNIQCNLRTVVESVWFDDAASGHFDLAIGAVVGSLLDPSDSFSAWYGKDGPQNYSFWDNKDFQALSTRIDREVDPAKRLPLVRQAEAIMEQDPPLLPIAWERINEVWYNYVKGLNPPISASSTSCAWIRSGSTRRELGPTLKSEGLR